MKGARHDLRHAARIIDFRRPFRNRAEEGAVVHFLKGVAAEECAFDLPDKKQHRGRVMARNVDAGRGVGRARTARDETDARPPGRFAHRLGHHRGARFVTANGDRHLAVAQSVQHRQIAFTGNAENMAHAIGDQLIHKHLRGATRAVWRFHKFQVPDWIEREAIMTALGAEDDKLGIGEIAEVGRSRPLEIFRPVFGQIFADQSLHRSIGVGKPNRPRPRQ